MNIGTNFKLLNERAYPDARALLMSTIITEYGDRRDAFWAADRQFMANRKSMWDEVYSTASPKDESSVPEGVRVEISQPWLNFVENNRDHISRITALIPELMVDVSSRFSTSLQNLIHAIKVFTDFTRTSGSGYSYAVPPSVGYKSGGARADVPLLWTGNGGDIAPDDVKGDGTLGGNGPGVYAEGTDTLSVAKADQFIYALRSGVSSYTLNPTTWKGTFSTLSTGIAAGYYARANSSSYVPPALGESFGALLFELNTCFKDGHDNGISYDFSSAVTPSLIGEIASFWFRVYTDLRSFLSTYANLSTNKFISDSDLALLGSFDSTL